MGKAFWNIEHILLFAIKNHAIIFTKSCTAKTKINCNIINLTFKSTNKLTLRMFCLKMKST